MNSDYLPGSYAVVGAGITGCVTALRLAEAGHSVTLFERASVIGGSLRDAHDEAGYWFKGCQYLTPEADWFRHIAPLIECEFVEFEHRYASWTRWDSRTVFRDDIALPCLDMAAPPVPQSLPETGTMAERFALYGPQIGGFLSGVASRSGYEADALHVACAASLQMSAVMFSDSIASMLSRKRATAAADSLFALPRHAFGADYARLRAALPRDGFDVMFAHLHKLLEARGVRMQLAAAVGAAAGDQGHFFPTVDGARLDVDYTVWCCNPVPLMAAAGLGRLDSPGSKFVHFNGFVEGAPVEEPIYIQCYDPTTPVYRLYLYPSPAGTKVCVECHYYPKQSQEETLRDATMILGEMWPGGEIRLQNIQKFIAHFLYTPNDDRIMSAFRRVAADNRFVSGAWELFGRDQKIDAIDAGLLAMAPTALADAGS